MIECSFDIDATAFIIGIRIVAAFTLPINLFGLYCVITKTPAHMKDARIILCIYQLSNTGLDFTMNILFEPFILNPLPFGKPQGLITVFGGMSITVGILISLCGIGNTMCSFLQLFHFRLNFILPNDSFFKMTSQWKFMLLRLSYYLVFDSTLFIAFFLDKTNMLEQAFIVSTTYSCGQQLLDRPDVEMFDGPTATRLFTVGSIQAAIVTATSVFMICVSHYNMKKMPAISAKTLRLQREFQFSLCMQAFVPIGIILIPGFVFFFFLMIEFMHMQTFANVFMIIISLHGAIATIIMIIFNRNYRRFVINFLFPTNSTSPISSSQHQ